MAEVTERLAIRHAACPDCKARQGEFCAFKGPVPRREAVHSARLYRAALILRRDD